MVSGIEPVLDPSCIMMPPSPESEAAAAFSYYVIPHLIEFSYQSLKDVEG